MHHPRSLVFARKSVGWPDGQSLAPSVGGHSENIFRTMGESAMFVTAVSETNQIVVLSYILFSQCTTYLKHVQTYYTIFVTNELVQP